MKRFIKTINSTVCSCDLAEVLEEEYDIKSEFGDNGIYVNEEDYEIAEGVLFEMELEIENNGGYSDEDDEDEEDDE